MIFTWVAFMARKSRPGDSSILILINLCVIIIIIIDPVLDDGGTL